MWRSVELQVLPGPVSVRYPQISTVFSYSGPSNDSSWGTPGTAHLTILAELENYSNNQVSGTLRVTVPNTQINIEQTFTIQGKAQQTIVFSNESFPLLNVANPNIWWPWQMGSQEFYNVTFTVSGSAVYDTLNTRFAIRQVSSELLLNKYRLYRVNGQRILIKGGGWSPDLFQRESFSTQPSDSSRLAAEISYTKALGLNSIRLEGKFPEEQFWSAADDAGILLLPGWCW